MSGLFYRIGRSLGQAALPVIRRAQWSWQTVAGSEEDRLRAEQELGSTLAVRVREELEVRDAPADTARVQALGEQLTTHVRDPRFGFRVGLVRLPEPTALALPGGFVFLSLALLDLCQRYEDELAFVIGHEMAHVVRGHAADRMLEESALKVVSGLLRRAGPLGLLVKEAGFQALTTAYAREAEFEADELGSRLAAAAGHHPLAGVRLFERLQAQASESAPTGLGAYFASHPSPAERIRHLGRVWKGKV